MLRRQIDYRVVLIVELAVRLRTVVVAFHRVVEEAR